jgi:hypothetical protein
MACKKATFAGIALAGLGNPSVGAAVELIVAEIAGAAITVGDLGVKADSESFMGAVAGGATADGAVILMKTKAGGVWGCSCTLGGAGTIKYIRRYRHLGYFGSTPVG